MFFHLSYFFKNVYFLSQEAKANKSTGQNGRSDPDVIFFLHQRINILCLLWKTLFHGHRRKLSKKNNEKKHSEREREQDCL